MQSMEFIRGIVYTIFVHTAYNTKKPKGKTLMATFETYLKQQCIF